MSFLLSSLLNVGHLKKWLIQNENCLHVLTLISLHTYDFLLRKKEYWQSFHSIQWKDIQKWQKAPYNDKKLHIIIKKAAHLCTIFQAF